jgi:hypothetical protein
VETAIDTSHLAGQGTTGPGHAGRLWTGWATGSFPLAWLEPYVVTDSNGVSELPVNLRCGAKRTWHLRHLTPSAPKREQLRGYYDELKSSVDRHGILTPVLIWRSPDSKFYLRYGASRVHVARELGLTSIPAVICDYAADSDQGARKALRTPLEVLMAFGPPAQVGWLEVSHERIDAHHLEPKYPG